MLTDIQETDFFSSLVDTEKDLINKEKIVKTYHKEQEIVAFSSSIKHLFVVQEGCVKLHRNDEEGQEIIIKILKQGDWFFDTSVFLNIDAPANVTAIEASKVIMIPSDIIRRILHGNDIFFKKIVKKMASDFHSLIDRVDDVVLKTPYQRVAHFLLKLYIENGAQSTTFDLPYKKSLIANELGMKAETFSRTLSKLKQAGVVIQKNKVTLPHLNALCEVCDVGMAKSCSNYEEGRCPSIGVCETHN